MVPHIVYFDILVTIQRQFINVQYRDTSKVENMVCIGPGTYTNITKTAIASLYFQCYNPISYSGHPRGSTKYRLAKMWGGGAPRGVHEGHIWPTAYYMYVQEGGKPLSCLPLICLSLSFYCVYYLQENELSMVFTREQTRLSF